VEVWKRESVNVEMLESDSLKVWKVEKLARTLMSALCTGMRLTAVTLWEFDLR
jgi:hypothetical protein